MRDFLVKIMEIDSTSGQEINLAEFLLANFLPPNASVEVQPIANGQKNLFFKWGKPKIIFCTHLDTVAPYLPPRFDAKAVYGRGACDAKGQIAVIYKVCQELVKTGQTDFGMLLLAGEEIGSYGAEVANKLITGCKYVIVCEPTENKLIRAAKGNILFTVNITGKAAHSGYPELGESAVENLCIFLQKLAAMNFPQDPILGSTNYNIGLLSANNPANVVADQLTLQLLFRTTFATCDGIEATVRENLVADKIKIERKYYDLPQSFHVLDGFATDVVAFGSDAPKLFNLGKPLLYGPGSIFTAHTANEMVLMSDLERAVHDLQKIYYGVKS